MSKDVNPNNYNPISNLQTQYNPVPLGKRITLLLHINSDCIIPGGVETVLRRGSSVEIGNGNLSTSDLMDAAVENSIELDFSNVDLNDSHARPRSGTTNHAPPSLTDSNPFDFLDDTGSATGGVPPPPPMSSGTPVGSSSPKFKLSNFGSRLKHTFERGVTSIAVQAQKATGGETTEIHDLITVGAYVQNGLTGEFDECLGMTERVEMPKKGNIENGGHDENGVTFQVPILLPPHLMEEQYVQAGGIVQFKLWIRSGAAIFARNRGLRRYYDVGTATLRLGALKKAIKQQESKQHHATMSMPLLSTLVVDGQVTVTAMKDLKFPPFCGSGWTLTDPRTDTGYTTDGKKRILFNPPLDQSFIFPIAKSLEGALTQNANTPSILLATERATESTLVLPLAVAMSQLFTKATDQSYTHSVEVASKLQYLHGKTLHDPMKALQEGYAQCQIELLHFMRYPTDNSFGGGQVHVTVNLQRPDSIFENCLGAGALPSFPYDAQANYPPYPAISIPFFPRLVDKTDERLLPGLAATNNSSYIGRVRIQLLEDGVGGAGSDVFSPIGPAGGVGTSPRTLEALIDLEPYLNLNRGGDDGSTMVESKVMDVRTGKAVGVIVIKIAAHNLDGMVDHGSVTNSSESSHGGFPELKGGLLSLVGLDTLLEGSMACYPHCDAQKVENNSMDLNGCKGGCEADQRRIRQLATMGEFLTFDYMDTHSAVTRKQDSKMFQERFEKYHGALLSTLAKSEEYLSPDKRKDPRPFRPSSSRMDNLLSGIGFNVHVQNFTVLSITKDDTSKIASSTVSALFQNVTCGAPADHFRGFSSKSKDGASFSGGLRRLESARLATAERMKEAQDNLINAVTSYFSRQATERNLTGRSMRHVASSDVHMAQLRNAAMDATQNLHRLNWDIAVRRGNCFSQALGIAVTLYLAHVSDAVKLKKGAWAELWKKHGFLITFEGLLSAAGKELGMIEDASVGINMLRMVSVVLVAANERNTAGGENSSSCVPVPDSPFVKWVKINHSGHGSKTQYVVEICLDTNFYAQRVPVPLKSGASIKFFPLLYEMGVDIRQWGANAGANVKVNSNRSNTISEEDEMDDDEAGIADSDFLIALNYEAFRKMNAYAHSVYLVSDPQTMVNVTWEHAHFEQQIVQPIHPMLTALYEFIRSSAGKMEHGILDEAANAAGKLGGGSAIFCKSGKDRTAMQVSFKQSQFVNRYLASGGNGHADKVPIDSKKVFKEATIMRIYGIRLPICDKNVGQSLYAFNSLQARFMPEVLKPPPRTLAGFLKGGRVFSREGGIES